MASNNDTAEVVYGEEPWNNGEYSWCGHCRGYVFIDYWEERKDAQGYPVYFHRGHPMHESEKTAQEE